MLTNVSFSVGLSTLMYMDYLIVLMKPCLLTTYDAEVIHSG